MHPDIQAGIQRQAGRDRQRVTAIQAKRQTCKHTASQPAPHEGIHTDIKQRQAGIHADIQREKHRHTYIHTYRQADKHTGIHTGTH